MCTCIQCGVGKFRKKTKKSTRLKGQYIKYKKICKFKNIKDLERGKIKILLRFMQEKLYQFTLIRKNPNF